MVSRSFVSLASILGLAFALGGCKVSPDGDSDPPADDPDGDGVPGAAPFFLPTGEPTNTAAPRVEVDARGGTHAVYPAYAGGGAYYAYCAADCADSADVQVVELPTQGTTANAMIALDADGRPQVLLSTFSKIYYAAPSGDPTDATSWQIAEILDHGSSREVTGEALALDAGGRPRFVMHTYVAYLGIGQEAPETHFVSCDADCFDPASWTASKIADQIWRGSSLRFDSAGAAHLGTVAMVVDDTNPTSHIGAYLTCDAGCETAEGWLGTGLIPAYLNDLEAVSIAPEISLALTSDGAPRFAMLANLEGAKSLVYFSCAAGCTDPAAWAGTVMRDLPGLGAGVDLALDAADQPRVAHTFDYNIGLAYCDAPDCTVENAPWELAKVELGNEMDPDEIFLWDNCNVAAWFLHSPSLALDDAGRPRVGYQARDISGGVSNPDPTKPDCVAGTDMTWTRLAKLGAL